MNIQRLEMMRVMMERVVAGSWKPEIDVTIIEAEKNDRISPDFTINKFDLDSWASITKYDHTQNNLVCGFSACAVGHACFDEEFRKLGWSWNGSQPRFGGFGGLSAAEKFFGITHHQASRLFLPESYLGIGRRQYASYPANIREAKMVADRIQKLIDTGRI